MSVSASVVDAWAALAFLQGEDPAAAVMKRYLRRAENGNLRLLMSVINLGEVYYRIVQLSSESRAADSLRLIRRLPIEIVQAREPLVMKAAGVKARFRVSYADAFAIATALVERASVLTGDPEILALPRNVVRVVRLERS